MSTDPMVLVADADDSRQRLLVEQLLKRNVTATGMSSFPPDAAELARHEGAVLVCPARPGAERALAFCREWKRRNPASPVIVHDAEKFDGLRLRFVESGVDDFVDTESLPEAVQALSRPAEPGTTETAAASDTSPAAEPAPPTRMYLKLSRGELGNAMQFLTLTRRTGELRLEFPASGGGGRIFLEQGRVVHADYNGTEGTEACARMLAEEAAEAHFFDDAVSETRSVSLPTDQLLLEAAVLADTLAAGEAGIDAE